MVQSIPLINSITVIHPSKMVFLKINQVLVCHHHHSIHQKSSSHDQPHHVHEETGILFVTQKEESSQLESQHKLTVDLTGHKAHFYLEGFQRITNYHLWGFLCITNLLHVKNVHLWIFLCITNFHFCLIIIQLPNFTSWNPKPLAKGLSTCVW